MTEDQKIFALVLAILVAGVPPGATIQPGTIDKANQIMNLALRAG
jgi:hypothetical protein